MCLQNQLCFVLFCVFVFDMLWNYAKIIYIKKLYIQRFVVATASADLSDI